MGTGLKVWVYAIKNIKKGSKTYDYGFGFDEDYKDFPCKCGSKNCVGFIVREGEMENKKTKVDIILPNFNSSNYIRETLNSVINQTYSSWNLIIVDDCSDKKTVNILKKYSKNKRFKIYFVKKKSWCWIL